MPCFKALYGCNTSIRQKGPKGEKWSPNKEYAQSSAMTFDIEAWFKVTAQMDKQFGLTDHYRALAKGALIKLLIVTKDFNTIIYPGQQDRCN